jgi:hypothetical protein
MALCNAIVHLVLTKRPGYVDLGIRGGTDIWNIADLPCGFPRRSTTAQLMEWPVIAMLAPPDAGQNHEVVIAPGRCRCVSANQVSYELTGRVRCGIDTLHFRIKPIQLARPTGAARARPAP